MKCTPSRLGPAWIPSGAYGMEISRRRSNPLRLLFNPRAERKYFDLRRVLSARPNGRSQFHIYYAVDHASDRRHALRMQAVPQVTLHEYAYSRHNLVRMLRDTGQLQDLVAAALRLRAG